MKVHRVRLSDKEIEIIREALKSHLEKLRRLKTPEEMDTSEYLQFAEVEQLARRFELWGKPSIWGKGKLYPRRSKHSLIS